MNLTLERGIEAATAEQPIDLAPGSEEGQGHGERGYLDQIRSECRELRRQRMQLWEHHLKGCQSGEENDLREEELGKIRRKLFWREDVLRQADLEAAAIVRRQRLMEERERLKLRFCHTLAIILTVIFLVPFLLASIYVIHPFMVTMPFRDTRCHVINVTKIGGESIDLSCSAVLVAYQDQDRDINVTTFLHLDEASLETKCIPEFFLPNCTTVATPCSIDCLYNPSNYEQVIEHRKFHLFVVLASAASLIPSVAIVLSWCACVNILDHRTSSETE